MAAVLIKLHKHLSEQRAQQQEQNQAAARAGARSKTGHATHILFASGVEAETGT